MHLMFIPKPSHYSAMVPVQLSTTVLDRSTARITMEELAHTSNTWKPTYMNTMVNAKVAGTVETKEHSIPTMDALLVTTKPIVTLPFGCKWVKGLVESLPVWSNKVNVIAEPMESHRLTHGVMATSTCGDLCHGSRRVGMRLRNLSGWEVRILLKTIISNVQDAEIIPDIKASGYMGEVLPVMEQIEPTWVSQSASLILCKNELTQLTPISPQRNWLIQP